MKRLLLIVPDGVAVRNYLYSSFISELQAKGVEVILYHQISNAAIEEIKKVQPTLSIIKAIPYFIENPKARILRESLAYARLKFNAKKLKNPTVMNFWNCNQKGIKQKLLYRLAEAFGTVFSWNYKLILSMEELYDVEISKSAILDTITKDIEQLNPDYILNLHQRALISTPVIAVAKKKGIRTATVIFSWDNVPKARLISRYDKYLVWSDLMTSQLTLLYPEIKKEQIDVVGTPQFEFYFRDEFLESKELFYSKYGLDLNRKTICFSANDLSSPYEANYFEDICEEVAKTDEETRPQILFRRCPVDKTSRFDKVLEKYKDFVFAIDPDWRTEKENGESFSSIYPAFNDVSLLVNTVKHSDLVINLGSTMAHDFAVYNKPCLYLNYNPVVNSTFKVEMSYNFEHFKSMEELEAVGWINNKLEIIEKINLAINDPDKTGPDRKKWMQKIVRYPLNKSCILISEVLLR
jgi:hypothetical protein